MEGARSRVVVRESVRSIRADGGYPLSYRIWRSDGAAAGTIVLVNGMISHAGWFRKIACLLAARQLHIVGADRRGSGLNRISPGDAPSRNALLSDLQRIIDAEDAGGPICIVGWCWGALPVVNLSLEPNHRLSRIALLAPALFASRNVERATQEQLIASRGHDEAAPVVHAPLTAEMFSKRRAVQQFIVGDELAQWSFSRRLFRITQEMSEIARAQLSKIPAPVFVVFADDDCTVDNVKTLKAVEALGRPEVVSTSLPCSHGIHLERPREVARQIAQWLTVKSGPAEGGAGAKV
jgi:alpha-beta hydrolase superfamily lysophospholipase